MKRFKFVVEIEVDETWVADGFDINKENVKDRIGELLPFASEAEFDAKVLKAPARDSILKTQGYKVVA